jgi:hypothetical protein
MRKIVTQLIDLRALRTDIETEMDTGHLFEILATCFATSFEREPGPSPEGDSDLNVSQNVYDAISFDTLTPTLNSSPVALRLTESKFRSQEALANLKQDLNQAAVELFTITKPQCERMEAATLREARIKVVLGLLCETLEKRNQQRPIADLDPHPGPF